MIYLGEEFFSQGKEEPFLILHEGECQSYGLPLFLDLIDVHLEYLE